MDIGGSIRRPDVLEHSHSIVEEQSGHDCTRKRSDAGQTEIEQKKLQGRLSPACKSRTNRDGYIHNGGNCSENTKNGARGAQSRRRNLETESQERHSPEDPAKLGKELTNVKFVLVKKLSPIQRDEKSLERQPKPTRN